jgi:hypothetical protein
MSARFLLHGGGFPDGSRCWCRVVGDLGIALVFRRCLAISSCRHLSQRMRPKDLGSEFGKLLLQRRSPLKSHVTGAEGSRSTTLGCGERSSIGHQSALGPLAARRKCLRRIRASFLAKALCWSFGSIFGATSSPQMTRFSMGNTPRSSGADLQPQQR